MTNKGAAYWIEKLQLSPHPEGGYFRQTYKADLQLPKEVLPAGFSGARPASTAIYFLLEAQNFSAFHCLRSDEIWHFYVGAPLLVHVIDAEGKYSTIQLGSDPEAGRARCAPRRGQGADVLRDLRPAVSRPRQHPARADLAALKHA